MMIELIPAYGRVYATMDVMLKDWEDGKDFKVRGGGPYCSIRDTPLLLETYSVARIYPSMLTEHFMTVSLKNKAQNRAQNSAQK